MEKLEFNLDELYKLETLLEYSKKISNIIDILYILEITNEKESYKYDIKLQELIKYIDAEEKLYKKINLSYKQCLKFAKLLSSQTKISILDDKASNCLKHYNNRIFKRVINILMNFVQNNQDFHQKMISNSLLINPTINEIPELQTTLAQGLNNSFKIQMSLNDDINSMFLSILENYIPNSEYPTELIKIKYIIASTNKSLEELILRNKFNIPDTIFLGAQFMNELLQESQLSYDIIKFAELKTKAQIEINKLIQIKDYEYSNESIIIESIIISCYLRAVLSLMNDEEVKNLQKEFEIQIDNEEYLQKKHNYQISENIILNCFKNFKKDKSKTRVLSTKSNI